MPYQECTRGRAICVCADVGANCHGDKNVVYPAGGDPHRKKNGLHCGCLNDAFVVDAAVNGAPHRQGNASDAVWRLYHENSVCSLHRSSCSSISKYVATAVGPSPSPHRP